MHIPTCIGHKRLTIFDLDGTLLDYDREERRAARAVGRSLAPLCGRTLPEVMALYRESKAEARRSPPSEDQHDLRFRHLSRNLGLSDEYAGGVRRKYFEWRVRACQPYEQALRLLAAFAERSDYMVVLTNGPDDLQKRRVAAAGLGSYFAQVYTSQGIGFTKPDPRAFEFVEAAWGLSPSSWRMVGDDPEADLDVPKRLGIETWRVAWGRGGVSRW